MPRVSQQHVDARRRQILDAALACFARQGFGATMRDITAESGLSAGAIYLYFHSKDEIVEAIADQRHARERERLLQGGHDADLAGALLDIADRFLGALDEPAERLERRVAIETWAEALRRPRVRALVRRGFEQPRALLAARLRRAQEQGELPAALDPAALALALIALFHGFYLQQAWGVGLDRRAFRKLIEQLLALAAHSAPARRTRGTARTTASRRRRRVAWRTKA